MKIAKKITPILLAIFLCIPVAVFAANPPFVPLSPELPLPGGAGQIGDASKPAASSITGLLNTLLSISVASAAVLAVVMVVIGGFQYMTTDSVFAMGNAKERIANAIIGLLIVLLAILMLTEINPNIVSLKLFDISTYDKT